MRVQEWSRSSAVPWRGAFVVEWGGSDPQPGKKGEKSRGGLGSHAYVLGLPCKVIKFDSNRLSLTVIEIA